MLYIGPDNDSLNSHEKGSIQQNILLSVYDKDYPVGNVSKAIDQIKNGIQQVLFWTDNVENLKDGKGGTIALVLDKSKSESTVEMCRAGSSVNNGGGIKAVRELYKYYLNSDINQLYATPRNCLDRTNNEGKIIPGGKAISKIYERLPDMKYWGIAPWYIMPGNQVELLDLRIHSKVDECKNKILNGKQLFIYSEKLKKLYSSMIENNYGIQESVSKSNFINHQLNEFKFEINMDENLHTSQYTYSTVTTSNSSNLSMLNIEEIIEHSNSKISIFKINLFDNTLLVLQKYLIEKGYSLVSLFPEGDNMYGYFVKSDNKSYALPYYMGDKNPSKDLQIQSEIISNFVTS